MESAGSNIQEAKQAAQEASKSGQYVTIFACFGLYLARHKRLNIHAPSDCMKELGYWHNGKNKSFTDSQIIADQNTGNYLG